MSTTVSESNNINKTKDLQVDHTLTSDQNPDDALNKSYSQMGSQEVEEPHYNFDSDGEPPQDEVGDKLTIIHKRQVVKEILEKGSNLGKPGRPFIVTVQIYGYIAKQETEEQRKAKI